MIAKPKTNIFREIGIPFNILVVNVLTNKKIMITMLFEECFDIVTE